MYMYMYRYYTSFSITHFNFIQVKFKLNDEIIVTNLMLLQKKRRKKSNYLLHAIYLKTNSN